LAADRAGVDRIGLDLETLGKEERQKGRETRLYHHEIGDAKRIFPHVTHGARFARVNPLHVGTQAEVEALIEALADVIMLPYFRTLAEVEAFSEIVGGRVLTVGLAETLPSLDFIEDIIRRRLFSEIHFGLTDLGIAMGKTAPEVLKDGRLLRAVALVRLSGMPFGIAGFARPYDLSLPYHPGKFAACVARLGASRAFIARSFFRSDKDLTRLNKDVAVLRAFLAAQ
jgi:citrate lyase beta subunit